MRRPSVRLLLAAGLAVALAAVAAAAGGAALLAAPPAAPVPPRTAGAVSPPGPAPQVTVLGAVAGRVPWQQPLRLALASGTGTAATVRDSYGSTVPGTVSAAGWRSDGPLLPLATYTAALTVRDSAGRLHRLAVTARTTPAARLLTARLSPGDDAVVGVGKPVAVTLSRDVEGAAARAAVTARLSVRASPATPGAWRWMDARTVHYRPAAFWRPGTTVSVRVDLTRLGLADGTWGSGGRTARFTVGDALVSTVDVRSKTMTVRRNGAVVRVMRASMGRPEFPTRNGTFIVLEKFRHKVMDSATLDLPPGTPAYRLGVDHAVRITNSGTFTHAAPWSLRDQGRRNVSHGCINLSPADAAWYFSSARRGDVVQVVGSTRGPVPWDAGSRDWNMSFAEWQAGALG